MNLAAALMENGKARHVFVPMYFFLPFTLSRDDTFDFARPALDSVGRAVLLTSIRMLVPEVAPEK
jgi:hypothetical protein